MNPHPPYCSRFTASGSHRQANEAMRQTARLPLFVRNLISSPPRRGEGLNNWLFRVARVLHPFRGQLEIIELVRAAISGQPVRPGEIERAVERSKAVAWTPG